MFSFQKHGDDKSISELLEFTLNLLRRTRPYLNEAQARIIAQDLIARAQYSYVDKPNAAKGPFLFSGKSSSPNHRREEKSYSSYSITKENKSPCGGLTDTQKSRLKIEIQNNISSTKADHSSVRKRTHWRSCSTVEKNTSGVINHRKSTSTGALESSRRPCRQENVSQKIFRSDVNAGAPNMKKKRLTESLNESNCSNRESDVFERLYAARKKPDVERVFKKKDSWIKIADQSLANKSRSSSHESMDVCIGSVQKALKTLKLSFK